MMDEIGKWLQHHGLGRYVDAFAENEIDLDALPHLTEDDLKEMGIALGPRRKLLAAIAALEVPSEPTAPLTCERMLFEFLKGGYEDRS